MCELICSVVTKDMTAEADLVEIYGAVEDLLWKRFGEKPDIRETFGATLADSVKEAKKQVRSLALGAFKSGKPTIKLASSHQGGPVLYAIYKSGLVHQSHLSGGCYCTFVHRTFMEYLAADQLASMDKATLADTLTLDPKQRMLVAVLASRLSRERAKWTDFLGVLDALFKALLNQYGTAVKKVDLKDFMERERWRLTLGVDIVVEAVTLLGDGATELFMDDHRPWYGFLSAVVPGAWAHWLSGPEYRLMVESTARFGNKTMLQRLVERAGAKNSTELNTAHLAAFISSRGRQAREYLKIFIPEYIEPISLNLACRVGDCEAVKKVLKESNVSPEEFREALKIQWSPLVWEELTSDRARCKAGLVGAEGETLEFAAQTNHRRLAELVLPCLSEVKLWNMNLRPDFVVFLASALNVNKSITIVDLSSCSISDEGAKAIAEALNVNKTITSIDLRKNSFSAVGARAVIDALNVNTTITSFELESELILVADVSGIACALKVNKSITGVDLWSKSINDKGAKAIAEALKVNKTITAVNLGANSIGAEGAKAIAEALKVSQSTAITTIDLLVNSIGDEGAKAIAEALKLNSSITFIDMGSNYIGDEGAKAIAGTLKVNSTITTIDLRHKDIGAAAKSALKNVSYPNRVKLDAWVNH